MTSFGPNFGGAEVYTNTRKGYVAECPNTGKLIQNLQFTPAHGKRDHGRDPERRRPIRPRPRRPGSTSQPRRAEPWLDGVTTKDGGDAMAAVKAALGS